MSVPLSDMLANKGLRLIQYGPSSAGKSVRAAGAARWGRVEFHDFDSKGQNLAAYVSKFHPELMDRITVVSYEGIDDDKKAEKFLARVKELRTKPDITTLVIDSYTRFEDIYLNHLMSRITLSSTGFGSPRTNSTLAGEKFVFPGTMDGSLLTSGIKKLMGWLKDCPINIILNAHLREPFETKSGGIEDPGTIAARGQIREFLPTEFTEFHRLFVDAYGKHRVQAKPTAQYLASTALTEIPTNGVMLDNSLAVFDAVAIKQK